eukprot:385030-Prymnesium_polylepis.1
MHALPCPRYCPAHAFYVNHTQAVARGGWWERKSTMHEHLSRRASERAASRRVGHRRDAERVCGVRAKSPNDLAVWAKPQSLAVWARDLDH